MIFINHQIQISTHAGQDVYLSLFITPLRHPHPHPPQHKKRPILIFIKRMYRINQAPIKPPQQLNEDLIEFDLCNILTHCDTLAPSTHIETMQA